MFHLILSYGLFVLISHIAIAIGDEITTYLSYIVQELSEYHMNFREVTCIIVDTWLIEFFLNCKQHKVGISGKLLLSFCLISLVENTTLSAN